MNNLQKTNYAKQLKSQQGIVLLEALIAILIFSFGILAITGLQGAMIKNTTDSNYRAQASYIVQQQLGGMWANPTALASFASPTTISLSSQLPGTTTVPAQLVITRNVGNNFNFRVQWQTPGQVAHNFETNASIDAN